RGAAQHGTQLSRAGKPWALSIPRVAARPRDERDALVELGAPRGSAISAARHEWTAHPLARALAGPLRTSQRARHYGRCGAIPARAGTAPRAWSASLRRRRRF